MKTWGLGLMSNEEKNSNIKELLKQPFQNYEKPTLSANVKS